ncbi:radical SAM family heme chaperone HemW [Caldinitratiruptor microaerophilus]|uniref:Heme chaperone HemW n=1 Tax=Caldinitratiruptor microaerophilus TaxID=671077 RepID=A0AA35G9G8_9FIRM|nr:radical SAM family heme chaperone HemW [Caldinitratiruptor microaerophilus]BDG61443.1 coproporphyrinogen III oxidase [Caldinitratiruptor microaerophilus]
MRPIALYVHIPYCPRKCLYCDFNSHAGTARAEHEAYVAALEREMEHWARRFASGRLPAPAPGFPAGDPVVPTVFVGGGTPTQLDADLLARVVRRVRELFPVAPDAEFTVEANPGSVDVEGEKLAAAREAGANRISLGVQAVQDDLLRRLGRVHTAREAEEAVRLARLAGFRNLNLDLMYGLPGQTTDQFRETLEWAVAQGPEHVSAYSLIVEEGTAFHALYEAGRLSLPPEEEEEAMDRLAGSFLAAHGYERYEVSNYARPGYRCRHNLVYWRNEEYLGLGAGAHSYLGGRRFWNVRLPAAYRQAVRERGTAEEGGEALDLPVQMAETMILGLRLTDGVEEERFLRRFGRSLAEVYGTVLGRLERAGLMARAGGRWRLTPRGLRLGNRVWAEFLP